MTAQSSTIKRPGFLTYFLYRLGRLKFLTVILAVLEFFTFPFYTIMLDRYAAMATSSGDVDADMLETLRDLTHGFNWYIFAAGMIGAAIVSLIIMLSAFRYLNNKQYVNMDMTLPVTHNQRFFGDTLASFASIFVPHLLSILTGVIMTARIHAYDGIDKILTESDFYIYYSYTLNRDLSLMESILPHFVIIFLMLYFMTLFFISTTGKRVTAVLIPIVMQAAIPAALVFLGAIAESTTYGTELHTNIRFADNGPLAVLSPVTFLLTYLGHRKIGDEPWILIILAVYLAALFVCSYFIQKNRRAERTGEAFVLRYARHTYTAVCVLAVSAYFWWQILCPEDSLGSGLSVQNGREMPVVFSVSIWLFASLLIFVVAELVGGGKLKKLPLTAIRFAATTAGCAVLCSAVTLTDGFGAGSYIPGADAVKSIDVYFRNGYDGIITSSIPYEDITEFHRKLISERPEAWNNTSCVTINYNGDRGTLLERGYNLTPAYTRKLYELIFRNGGFADSGYEAPQTEHSIIGINVNTGKHETQTLTPTDTYVMISDITDENGEPVKYHIPLDKLIEAIQADASDVTFEQLYLSAYGRPGWLQVKLKYPGSVNEDDYAYCIYPFFNRTVKLLNEYGIDMFGEADYHYAFISKKISDYPNVEISSNFMAHSGEDVETHRLNLGSSEFMSALEISAERSYYTGKERYFLTLVTEEMYQNHVSEEEYIYLPVPETYNDAARQIFENAQYDYTALQDLLENRMQ